MNSGKVLTRKELVAKGGYGKVVQEDPQKALQTEGYKQALAEYGLTQELVSCALVDDIERLGDDKQRRHQELKLAGDWLGMSKAEKEGDTFNIAVLMGKYFDD